MTRARTIAEGADTSTFLTATSNLDATKLTTGTIPNARYGTPTFSAANLTSLPVGATNTPAFLTKMSSAQTIANSADATLQFNSISDGFDTDSGFNTGTYTYTIPSGKGGKYFMYCGVYLHSNADNKFVALKFVTTHGLKGETYTGSINADLGYCVYENLS